MFKHLEKSSMWICGVLFIWTAVLTAFFQTEAFSFANIAIRHYSGKAQRSDYQKALDLCRERKFTACADKAAEEVLNLFPNDPLALGHLAVRLTQKGEYEKAAAYYDAYFSIGGNSQDVVNWYQKVPSKFSF